MSAITRLARDPSCLMAIDALGGARWMSSVKPDGSTALAYTNSIADGVFRAVDNTANKWAETAQNFSGFDVSGGLTVAAAIIPSTDESSSSKKYHIFCDNGYMANNQTPIGIAVDKQVQNGTVVMLLDTNKVQIGKAVGFASAPITLGAKNTIVYSLDPVANKRRIIINNYQAEDNLPTTHTNTLYDNSADTYSWSKKFVLFTANTTWRNPDDKLVALLIWGRGMSMSGMAAINKIIGG